MLLTSAGALLTCAGRGERTSWAITRSGGSARRPPLGIGNRARRSRGSARWLGLGSGLGLGLGLGSAHEGRSDAILHQADQPARARCRALRRGLLGGGAVCRGLGAARGWRAQPRAHRLPRGRRVSRGRCRARAKRWRGRLSTQVCVLGRGVERSGGTHHLLKGGLGRLEWRRCGDRRRRRGSGGGMSRRRRWRVQRRCRSGRHRRRWRRALRWRGDGGGREVRSQWRRWRLKPRSSAAGCRSLRQVDGEV